LARAERMKSLYRILKNQPESLLNKVELDLYPEFELDTDEDSLLPEEEKEEEVEEEEAEEEKEDFLAEIYTQAKIILDAATKEAEDIKAAAYNEGYKSGNEEGYKNGSEQAIKEYNLRFEHEFKELQQNIAKYIKDVESTKEQLLEQYIDDLKNISLAIGEKIVQTSLKSSSGVVERMILSATGRIKKSAWAKIYIGKGEEMLDIRGDVKFLQELSKLSDNVKIIMLEEEDTGTCIVELPDEIIDISVGTQLENIKEILNNARL
jgi:flagellar assembly protein FliH